MHCVLRSHDKNHILIAGAGPSGLTLATELSQRNIPCTIIDKADGPAPLHESRALAFNARSQAILALSGVAARIKSKAHLVERVRLCWKGQVRNEVSIKADRHQPAQMIMLRQGQVERALLQYLQEHRIDVAWNIHNGPNLIEQHPFVHLCTDMHWQSDFKVSYRLVKRYNRGLTLAPDCTKAPIR